MIKHIVMWDFATDEDLDLVKENFKNRLEGLKDRIDTIIKIEVGFNINGTPSAKDIVLYSEFGSMDDLNAYQIHPAHVEVGSYIKSVTKDRIVADYEV